MVYRYRIRGFSRAFPGLFRGDIHALKCVNHHGGGADDGRVCPYEVRHGYSDDDGGDVCGRVHRHGRHGEDEPL